MQSGQLTAPASAPPKPVVDDYIAVRAHTEAIAAPLSAEDQTVQSMPDVSPTKWHRAHTTWFFETFVLGPHRPEYAEFHPAYGYLFNSYYEAVGARHPRAERGLLSRPGIEDIARYRHHVDEAMVDLLGTAGPLPAVCDLVELGLHHEQQHQELALMDIKHVLSVNPLSPTYRPRQPLTRAGHDRTAGRHGDPPGWIAHDGGLVEIGHDGHGFAFDNETPRHTEYLEPFLLADRPVTCGDWLAFIDDGGYQRPDLWLSDGWASIRALGWDSPLYWHRSHDDSDGWSVFTLHGPQPIDPDEPVCHVSYYEADAFAHWSGARLPTETEWEAVAAATHRSGDSSGRPFDHLHPASTSGPGFGQVWEWTSSAYLPYPRFRPAAGAVGEYNGKFMVGQHVLRGGCCVSPPGHLRPTYRNFFPPAARWAFSGLRLARSA